MYIYIHLGTYLHIYDYIICTHIHTYHCSLTKDSSQGTRWTNLGLLNSPLPLSTCKLRCRSIKLKPDGVPDGVFLQTLSSSLNFPPILVEVPLLKLQPSELTRGLGQGCSDQKKETESKKVNLCNGVVGEKDQMLANNVLTRVLQQKLSKLTSSK